MDAKQEAREWTAALAKAIRAEQAAADLSDAEVAAATGIPSTTYWSLSKGKTKVSTAQLRKIARALGMSPGQLFDLADARMAEVPVRTRAEQVEAEERAEVHEDLIREGLIEPDPPSEGRETGEVGASA